MHDRRRFAQAPDDFTKAAGIIPIAADSGRILLNQRGSMMDEAGKYAGWGGYSALGESSVQNATREFYEESLYQGPIVLIPAHNHSSPIKNLTYETFIGVIPSEFEPIIDQESMGFRWCTMSEVYGGKINFHPEVQKVLSEVQELLRTVIKKSGLLNEENLYGVICHKLVIDVDGSIV